MPKTMPPEYAEAANATVESLRRVRFFLTLKKAPEAFAERVDFLAEQFSHLTRAVDVWEDTGDVVDTIEPAVPAQPESALVQGEVTEEVVCQRVLGMPLDTQRSIVCAIVGHSKVQTVFFGYYNCARCGEQVGDKLGSVYDDKEVVVVGHDCPVCRANAAKLTWKDTLLLPEGKLPAAPATV